jgi:hypothetical protein
MTQRRGTIIKQGAITDIMSRLSELLEREKDPDTAVSLGEIFRAKEYMAEIKGALKGYLFGDLAEIFTEKCGVNISARQIKYHFTRARNLGAKCKSGKKTDSRIASGGCVPSVDSQRVGAVGRVKENHMEPDSAAISSLKVPGFASENRAMTGAEDNVDSGAFLLDTSPKEL